MHTEIKVRDEFTFSLESPPQEFAVYLPAAHVTVREIIRARILQEVQEFNAGQPEYFHGLVQPEDAERVLNGSRLRRQRTIDAEQQVKRALEAFSSNRFILLVDDRQVEDLDQEIEVTLDTSVTFFKLVPLVGG